MIELFLAAALSAPAEGRAVPEVDAALGAAVDAIIKVCPGKTDTVAWRTIGQRTIELQPGLLVESAHLACITNGLKQAKIRYTFEDNRTR